MAELGSEMAELGSKMAELGSEMASMVTENGGSGLIVSSYIECAKAGQCVKIIVSKKTD